MLNSPNLFWWRNKLIYIMGGLRVSTFSANVHFWVNYSFTVKLSKLPFPLLFLMHKVCKAYLNQVPYLIRCYWDMGGCKINCMDATNYTGCVDACPIHEVTSSMPFIQVVRVSQGRESKQLWVSQDGRAGSQASVPCDRDRMNAELCLSTGHEPSTGAEKGRGARSRKARMKRRGRKNDTAVCLSLWNEVREWSIVRVDGIFNLTEMRTKL